MFYKRIGSEFILKIIKKQVAGQTELEVEIRYSEMDEFVSSLVNRIEYFDHVVFGIKNERQFKIKISDVYYVESVDKRTFIYTESSVFYSPLKLYQLFETLKDYDFVQVSKFCILNINALESIRSILNSRLEAALINGNKINVSRTYLSGIKAAFMPKEKTK